MVTPLSIPHMTGSPGNLLSCQTRKIFALEILPELQGLCSTGTLTMDSRSVGQHWTLSVSSAVHGHVIMVPLEGIRKPRYETVTYVVLRRREFKLQCRKTSLRQPRRGKCHSMKNHLYNFRTKYWTRKPSLWTRYSTKLKVTHTREYRTLVVIKLMTHTHVYIFSFLLWW